MLKVIFYSVGKWKDKQLESIAKHYQLLLSKGEVVVEYKELSDPSKGISDPIRGKKRETEYLSEVLPTIGSVYYLSEHGKQFDSPGFASFLQQKGQVSGKIQFLISGPYGVIEEELHQYFLGKISLSPLTFTHEMTRVVFLEQLYRASTILTGKPYHHM